MVACSKLRKQPCTDEPSCKWEVGKGCKKGTTGQQRTSPPRSRPSSRVACSKLRKQPCTNEPSCKWEVGKGCKKGTTGQQRTPPRRPSPPPRRPNTSRPGPSRPRVSTPSPVVDPTKFYCTTPFNKKNATIKDRVKSCEQGKKPHRNFKKEVYNNKQQCIEKCFYDS